MSQATYKRERARHFINPMREQASAQRRANKRMRAIRKNMHKHQQGDNSFKRYYFRTYGESMIVMLFKGSLHNEQKRYRYTVSREQRYLEGF